MWAVFQGANNYANQYQYIMSKPVIQGILRLIKGNTVHQMTSETTVIHLKKKKTNINEDSL